MSSRAVTQALRFRRVREESVALKLLRADLLPVVAAVLSDLLGGSPRTLPSYAFLESDEVILEELRDNGFELPKTAKGYLDDWVSAGFLIRRATEAREETVELSAEASSAIGYLKAVLEPKSAVTASRLANVSDLVAKLVQDTDPDKETRLVALNRESDRLTAEIARVQAGEVAVFADSVAKERLTEILRLDEEIPGDFADVSAALEKLNRDVREQLVNRDGSRGDVLDEVFAGVEVLENSDAGRSFNAFYDLALDAESSRLFDEAIELLLARDFVDVLSLDKRIFLKGLLSVLQRESNSVRDVMTGLSRSLSHFVETHAYLDQRCLAEQIHEAQAAALKAMATHGKQRNAIFEVELTTMWPSSVSTWKLHNPSDRVVAQAAERHEPIELDLEVLRQQVRASEIDFTELQAAIVEVASHTKSPSIAVVLAAHPATQGLASIVGLLILALQVGTEAEGVEDLGWTTESGVYYWGDLDSDGFAIGAKCRRVIPSMKTILMDEKVLADFARLAVPEPKPATVAESLLTAAERRCLDRLRLEALRLEQERVPMSYADAVLRRVLS